LVAAGEGRVLFLGGKPMEVASSRGPGMESLLNLFLDLCKEQAYVVLISCQEFWFGEKTSRKALEAYAAFSFFQPGPLHLIHAEMKGGERGCPKVE
jgi:hypothetical protein